MKCDRCKACIVKTVPESYQEDFYCLCGVNEDDIFEKSDGSLGCNIHYSKIRKMIIGDRVDAKY